LTLPAVLVMRATTEAAVDEATVAAPCEDSAASASSAS
jgi:hypothetical protein